MVCNSPGLERSGWTTRLVSRNPLTGLSGLQLIAEGFALGFEGLSQSPYGAKWFATFVRRYGGRLHWGAWRVAIPLRG